MGGWVSRNPGGLIQPPPPPVSLGEGLVRMCRREPPPFIGCVPQVSRTQRYRLVHDGADDDDEEDAEPRREYRACYPRKPPGPLPMHHTEHRGERGGSDEEGA